MGDTNFVRRIPRDSELAPEPQPWSVESLATLAWLLLIGLACSIALNIFLIERLWRSAHGG